MVGSELRAESNFYTHSVPADERNFLVHGNKCIGAQAAASDIDFNVIAQSMVF